MLTNLPQKMGANDIGVLHYLLTLRTMGENRCKVRVWMINFSTSTPII